eukprot:jgi/Mesvir1/13254/Mv12233-RA.1
MRFLDVDISRFEHPYDFSAAALNHPGDAWEREAVCRHLLAALEAREDQFQGDENLFKAFKSAKNRLQQQLRNRTTSRRAAESTFKRQKGECTSTAARTPVPMEQSGVVREQAGDAAAGASSDEAVQVLERAVCGGAGMLLLQAAEPELVARILRAAIASEHGLARELLRSATAKVAGLAMLLQLPQPAEGAAVAAQATQSGGGVIDKVSLFLLDFLFRNSTPHPFL